MGDYQARWHPTSRLCPRCLGRVPMRESVVMVQKWGGKDLRYRCSDFSYCGWIEVSGSDGLGDSDGQEILK